MRNFLSVSDLAKRYGISRGTIYNWLKMQNFPQGTKFGKIRRWTLEEIETWEVKKHD